jgi:catechol 2,3-dioxygenase-like lactoylglutathione lyase family enzyme
VTGWRALVTALALLSAAHGRDAAAAVIAVESISLTVANLDRTERFYRDVLGFETLGRQHSDDPQPAHLLGVESAGADTLAMRLGSERVEFVQYRKKGRAYPKDSRSPDLWFQHFAIIVSDMDRAYARVRHSGVAAISAGGPQTLPPQNGRVRAFKFRDPDGHPLELLYFPPGEGRPVWHAAPRGRVFLGIDHSAIGISDTEASRGFYGSLLGMSTAYEIVNRGPTQERLDGTSSAVVRITGMRPLSSDGPGIEFLDYRAPPTGRRAPVDAASDDIAHVHLVLVVDDLARTLGELEAASIRLVSPGLVELAAGRRAVMVRDPDGHTLLLAEPGPHRTM